MSIAEDFQAAMRELQSGNTRNAGELADRIVSAMPDNPDALLLSAAVSAAEQDYPAVVRKCGTVLKHDPANMRACFNAAVACDKLGRSADVISFCSRILKNQPDHASCLMLKAGAQYDTGDIEGAVESSLHLLSAYQQVPDTVEQLAAVFRSRGDSGIVRDIFSRCHALQPNDPLALQQLVAVCMELSDEINAKQYLDRLSAIGDTGIHYLLARSGWLLSKQQYGECIDLLDSHPDLVQRNHGARRKLAKCLAAVGEFTRASEILTTLAAENHCTAECYHLLGEVEDRLGHREKAVNAYRSAVALSPDSVALNYNLAILYDRAGNKTEALHLMRKCNSLSGLPELKLGYIRVLATAAPRQLSAEDREFIEIILEDDNIDSRVLSALVINLIRNDSELVTRLESQAVAGEYERFLSLFNENIERITGQRLLKLFYRNLPVADWNFERFSAFLRRTLLQVYAIGRVTDHDFHELCAALAIRCFIDGFVHAMTAEEAEQVEALRDEIMQQKDGLTAEHACLLAMYAPLHETGVEPAPGLREHGDSLIRDMVKLHCEDPQKEFALMQEIQSGAGIMDPTSKIVRSQYESNPYPVWQKLTKRTPRPLSEILKPVYRDPAGTRRISENPDILIAGCGTGSHAIQAALRIRHNSITAIDLSRRSLAFARRKSIEYGLEHIDFMQLDILDVPVLGRTFDVIESVGVLHHMNDPLEGLRRLASVLKTDGFMNIGLYSEKARRHILEAKALYDDPDRTISDDEIRMLRRDIMDSNRSEMVRSLSGYTDFYSLHECRDLIFHENEHNYSIAALSELLDAVGLKFLGFEHVDDSVPTRYRSMFPEDDAASDLRNWDRFENKYPDTFAGMYVFWCSKKH